VSDLQSKQLPSVVSYDRARSVKQSSIRNHFGTVRELCDDFEVCYVAASVIFEDGAEDDEQ
jgi:hypothetical protein